MGCAPRRLRSTRCIAASPGWSAWKSSSPAGAGPSRPRRWPATWQDFDFFFLHYKYTDAAGEDGDFARKVRCIEEFDAGMPAITGLAPDVLIVTGDHSTPARLKSHSWHPVPVLLACRELPGRRGGGLRRAAVPARRPRPARGQVPAAARAGARRPARQVRRVSPAAPVPGRAAMAERRAGRRGDRASPACAGAR